jgi:hypothetical protein
MEPLAGQSTGMEGVPPRESLGSTSRALAETREDLILVRRG